MNFLTRIFKSNKIECPRCLGKGNVDTNDIKRLNKELKWGIGKCAYCNGKGIINPKVLLQTPFENTYLTVDLPDIEIKKIFDNDSGAIKRSIEYEQNIDVIILQIKFLFNSGKLSKSKIIDFYKIQLTKSNISEKEIEKFNEYIEKVIKAIKS